MGEAETKECRTFFLHDRPWILPWTKSISYELDITFTSSRHNCQVIVTSSAIDVTSSTECKTSKEDTVSDRNCMDWVVWIRTNGLSYYRYSTNCVFIPECTRIPIVIAFCQRLYIPAMRKFGFILRPYCHNVRSVEEFLFQAIKWIGINTITNLTHSWVTYCEWTWHIPSLRYFHVFTNTCGKTLVPSDLFLNF